MITAAPRSVLVSFQLTKAYFVFSAPETAGILNKKRGLLPSYIDANPTAEVAIASTLLSQTIR